MKKLFAFIIAAIMLFMFMTLSPAEESTGIVAKVTTKKGPLKMREKAGGKGRVLTEIPNGTCILDVHSE